MFAAHCISIYKIVTVRVDTDRKRKRERTRDDLWDSRRCSELSPSFPGAQRWVKWMARGYEMRVPLKYHRRIRQIQQKPRTHIKPTIEWGVNWIIVDHDL